MICATQFPPLFTCQHDDQEPGGEQGDGEEHPEEVGPDEVDLVLAVAVVHHGGRDHEAEGNTELKKRMGNSFCL